MARKINVSTYASSTHNSFVTKHIENVDQWQIKVHASVILVFMLVSYLSKNICKKGLTFFPRSNFLSSFLSFPNFSASQPINIPTIETFICPRISDVDIIIIIFIKNVDDDNNDYY